MGEDENTPVDQTNTYAGGEQISGQPVCSPQDLDTLKTQYNELHDRFLRLAADFDNFRKRTARDRESAKNYANEQLAVEMLEIVDNLERAERSEDTHLREGLVQIRELCSAILQRHGISPIDALAKKFDPAEHEAIAHIPSDKDEGMVIDEVARGYRMYEKVIRFAKVAVSKKKDNEPVED
jgi:molecular chaperone GrpE